LKLNSRKLFSVLVGNGEPSACYLKGQANMGPTARKMTIIIMRLAFIKSMYLILASLRIVNGESGGVVGRQL